jgi:hypothetical protein
MDLFIVMLGIIGIIVIGLISWFELRNAEEDELIRIGFGTYVERSAFAARVTIALILCLLVLLVGLVY